MSSAVPRPVPCPRCGVEREFSAANPFRPFCSERCRLIDLGGWAEERYRIAARDESPSDDSTPESR